MNNISIVLGLMMSVGVLCVRAREIVCIDGLGTELLKDKVTAGGRVAVGHGMREGFHTQTHTVRSGGRHY